MTNIVTINTDASYNPIEGVGGYAFWIVYQGTRVVQSGPLKSCNSSHDAEVQAIGNALYALLKSKFENVKYVVINTDCIQAISAVRDNNKLFYHDSEPSIKVCRGLINKLRERYKPGPRKSRTKPFMSWRYVKAHTKGENARLWVNNWLDRAAKTAMRLKVQEKKGAAY